MTQHKVGDVFRGRYVLSGLLGKGGMGTVWRAHDRTGSREVAVKFMAHKLEASPLARRRFERECKAIASLPSRHVVKLVDHGVEGGEPFLVMELLEGEDLATRLKREGKLPLQECVRIVSDVCRGLRRAHELSLIHRDLKPANVFLAREPGGEVTKILDFGMVKSTASTFEQSVATESGAIVGSVHFASPEQAQGERDLDARSDLWSAAALTFRAVTGELPFPGEALGVVVLNICSRPLPRATAIAPELPAALDAFFEKAFQRDRAERFQSAIELADAFLAAATGKAPETPAPAAPFSGIAARPSHLDTFDHGGDATPVSDLGAATRVVDLEEEATRMLGVQDAAPAPPDAPPPAADLPGPEPMPELAASAAEAPRPSSAPASVGPSDEEAPEVTRPSAPGPAASRATPIPPDDEDLAAPDRARTPVAVVRTAIVTALFLAAAIAAMRFVAGT